MPQQVRVGGGRLFLRPEYKKIGPSNESHTFALSRSSVNIKFGNNTTMKVR